MLWAGCDSFHSCAWFAELVNITLFGDRSSLGLVKRRAFLHLQGLWPAPQRLPSSLSPSSRRGHEKYYRKIHVLKFLSHMQKNYCQSILKFKQFEKAVISVLFPRRLHRKEDVPPQQCRPWLPAATVTALLRVPGVGLPLQVTRFLRSLWDPAAARWMWGGLEGSGKGKCRWSVLLLAHSDAICGTSWAGGDLAADWYSTKAEKDMQAVSQWHRNVKM